MERHSQTARSLKRNVAILSAVMVIFSSICWGQSEFETVWKPQVRRKILVSIPDRKLAVIDDGRVIRIFQVAVGAPVSPTPTGSFEIASRVAEPSYFHAGTVIPPSAENPVGSRWMGLNQKGYGIHGTNEPKSIGNDASHGCIRLRNHDVEQLFKMVRVRDRVDIRSELDQEVAVVFSSEDALLRRQQATK